MYDSLILLLWNSVHFQIFQTPYSTLACFTQQWQKLNFPLSNWLVQKQLRRGSDESVFWGQEVERVAYHMNGPVSFLTHFLCLDVDGWMESLGSAFTRAGPCTWQGVAGISVYGLTPHMRHPVQTASQAGTALMGYLPAQALGKLLGPLCIPWDSSKRRWEASGCLAPQGWIPGYLRTKRTLQCFCQGGNTSGFCVAFSFSWSRGESSLDKWNSLLSFKMLLILIQSWAFVSNSKAHLWGVIPWGKCDGVSILRIIEGPCPIVMGVLGRRPAWKSELSTRATHREYAGGCWSPCPIAVEGRLATGLQRSLLVEWVYDGIQDVRARGAFKIIEDHLPDCVQGNIVHREEMTHCVSWLWSWS